MMIRRYLNNKVFLYMGTRYATYGLQFVLLLIVASKLGPYNYGIWGFITMLLNYFYIINFGIANSVNVLIVQNKGKQTIINDYVKSSLYAISILIGILILMMCLYGLYDFPLFNKYNIGFSFYVICIIAAFQYINLLFSNICRAQGHLLELSIFQTSIPVAILITTLFVNSNYLLYGLLCAYVIAHFISFLFFLYRKRIPLRGKFSGEKLVYLVKKGFFLFLYNASYTLIFTTTASVISYYYTVEEYGHYSFSYNLGHSVLLILEAFAFVIFPKIVDQFYTGTKERIKEVILSIRTNFVSFSHGLMYLAYFLFPYFMVLFPKYRDATPALLLTAISIVLSTNSFGYNTLLISKNKEKKVAIASGVSLILNIIIGILISLSGAPFYMVVLCMMVSYITFAYICAYYACCFLNDKHDFVSIISSIMPLPLVAPFVVALLVPFFDIRLSILPLLVFICLNTKPIKEIVKTIKLIAVKPSVIDIK